MTNQSLPRLYPGLPFSPQAALADSVGAADTILPVTDISAFPDAPNLATLGTEEDGETVLYTAKTDTALSGCVRGLEGAPRTWPKGELIGRNFTAKDHNDLIAGLAEALGRGQAAAAALEAHAASGEAHEELFSGKQDRLTGRPGQAVGFGEDGAAVATAGWSNPNLLDNWYFLDSVNQRGQTSCLADANGANWIYTFIDRYRFASLDEIKRFELTQSGIRMEANAVIMQYSETHLLPLELTASVLTADNRLFTAHKPANESLHATDGGITFVGVWDSKVNKNFIQFRSLESLAISAVKLEQGPFQTLAHKEGDTWVLNDPPPNKALELLKCQRYQVVFGDDANYYVVGIGQARTEQNVSVVVSLPVAMRTRPACSLTGFLALRNAENVLTAQTVAADTWGSDQINTLISVTTSPAPTPGFVYEAFTAPGGKVILDANL